MKDAAHGSLVVGVDVGGTFTDLFVLDEAAGTARVVKVPVIGVMSTCWTASPPRLRNLRSIALVRAEPQ